MSDPTAWANKRKAAMEHAKKLREQRQNSVEEPDELTFKPQTNKRPSYLKQQDSLDKLASQVSRDPNDPFEQPLPGNGAAYRVESKPPAAPYGQLSPGSDALGKELKMHGSLPPRQQSQQQPPQQQQQQQQSGGSTPYKSKFLQQYSSNGSLHSEQPGEDDYSEPANVVKDPNEIFLSSLRGGSSGGGGPGWNDDTSFGGFSDTRSKQKSQQQQKEPSSVSKRRSPAAATTAVAAESGGGGGVLPVRRNHAAVLDYNAESSQQDDYRPPLQQQQPPQYQHRSPPPPMLPADMGRSAAENRPGWNTDTDVQYGEENYDGYQQQYQQQQQPHSHRMPAVSKRTQSDTLQSISARKPPTDNSNSSHNYSMQPSPGSAVSDTAAVIARPNLSLLKQKMKRSESGASIGRSNSSQRLALGRDNSDNSSSSNFSNFSNKNNNFSDNNSNSNYSPYSEDSPSIASAAGIRRHNGRRSAPSQLQQQQQPQQQQQQQQQNAAAYNPTMGQPRNRIIKNSAVNQYAAADRQSQQHDADDDDNHVPQYQQQQQQQQYQQPPRHHQQQHQQQQQQQQQSYDRSPRQAGNAADFYEKAALSIPDAFDDAAAAPQNQLQCPDCGRKFNPAPFEKHVKICSKVFQQKRKTFDSSQMRVNHDPELAKLAAKAKKDEQRQAMLEAKRGAGKAGAANNENQPIRANKSRATAASTGAGTTGVGGSDGGKAAQWRTQSNAFREAMKNARQVSKAIATGAPLPQYVPSAPDPSMVPCPHCNRTFNQKAAERHIPQCQNIRAKPSSLKRGAGGGGGIAGTASSIAAKGKTKRGGFM